MSGLAACWTSSTSSALESLTALVASMPHRGSSGQAVWSGGAIGLGLAFKRRFNEEPTTAVVSAIGALHCVADIRLDNRQTLLSELSLPGSVTDTDIVLAAYDKWHDRFPEHLLGDFAVILYDGERRQLVAARDHMGVKPLFYRHDEAGLAVCSELAILHEPGPPFSKLAARAFDEQQVYTFVANLLPTTHDLSHQGLGRVPPGHILIYDDCGEPRLQRYWRPQPNVVPPDQITPDQLRKILEEAVECRLRGCKPVAAALSGGLDSSSIVCLAALIKAQNGTGPLPTFSAVFDKTPRWNERTFIEAVLKGRYVSPHFLAFDDYAPAEGLDETVKHQARLFSAPGLRMTSRICAAIHDAGYDAYLDGHGGDEVISHGFGRLKDLARGKDWRKLWQELGAVTGLYGGFRSWLFIRAFLKFSETKGAYRLAKILAWMESLWRGGSVSPLNGNKDLSPQQQTLATDHNEEVSDLCAETAEHLAILRSVNQTQSLEILELNAALRGVDILFPFFDKRVVEFCLSVPAKAKLDGGWLRLILRQAMKGVLPDAVRWRKSKFDFTPHLANGLLLHHTDLIEPILQGKDPASAYFNLKALKQSHSRLRSRHYRASGNDLQTVWRAIVLSAWLKSLDDRNS